MNKRIKEEQDKLKIDYNRDLKHYITEEVIFSNNNNNN
jgi:hypothetical protein